MFPVEVLDKTAFMAGDSWKSCLKEDLGDEMDMILSPEFILIITASSIDHIPPDLLTLMKPIKVQDTDAKQEDSNTGDSAMDAIAALYGAQEIKRNSIALVEAAFDGDLDEIKKEIDKGYHLESTDGHKHTALSEASAQGHVHIVEFLLDAGADPNALSDTGRSPLWRASFNSHDKVVLILLEAGGNKEYRDTISMESAYDVAQNDEIRSILQDWDISRTEKLMEERKRVIMANLEERIKTSAERELLARNLIRKDLVEKANNGDFEGIKNILETVMQEWQEQIKNNGDSGRPRATVEVRNDQGQSLLSIAAQNDDEETATFLLSHWKKMDEDRWDLTEGEISEEAKIFKPNVNSRDLKGWTPVCIAVFHESSKVLKLLLENGGNPNIRSSYNKNAWDLAKDELDAAEHVIKSKEIIRQVLIDNDQTNTMGNRVFGNGKPVTVNKGNIYENLGEEGSAMVMNIEMLEESQLKDTDTKPKKAKGGVKKDAKNSGKANKGGKKKK